MHSRSHKLNNVENTQWDILVVGGGATGLGVAVDAANRGYQTLLLEQSDFAKGTSSRSTKLIHGGVRYLQQGNISLVLESLHERGLLIKNAPHLVRHQSFIVPIYDWWEGPFYGIGLKVYDLLAGKLGLQPSRKLDKAQTLEKLPTIETQGLRGGVMYYDGQFDDARLAINLAQTAEEQGANVLNYCKVTSIAKSNGLVSGCSFTNELTGRNFEVQSKILVNATGIFTDSILNMDNPEHQPLIAFSQGIHIVLDKSFLPGDTAIMVPSTDDGRVLFAVPWNNSIIVGTTDTPVDRAELEPQALDYEIEFVLEHARRYLSKDPERHDIKSIFAGIRPLVQNGEKGLSTSAISRDHYINVSDSGLLTIAGGKWTTYRKMAEDVVEKAIMLGGLEDTSCETRNLYIHGYQENAESGPFSYYGSDLKSIQNMIEDDPELGNQIHPYLPLLKAHVVWAMEHEFALTVDDILSRRSRSLLFDAPASREAAPDVARIMAKYAGHNKEWINSQVQEFNNLSAKYLA